YQQMNEKLWRFLDELTLAHSQK
ncbi:glutamine amidotransferase, partial [Salmonella enterica subsp. enterica serovar Weltevreden]|nr:glutamine amidotransferase [Salmonella enterica subsp. enterica serovar Weltevreden]